METASIDCGGEWTEEVESGLGVTMICGACYEKARKICLGGDPIAALYNQWKVQ